MVAQNMLRTYEVKSDLMTLSNKPNALYKSRDLIYSNCAHRVLSYHLVKVP